MERDFRLVRIAVVLITALAPVAAQEHRHPPAAVYACPMHPDIRSAGAGRCTRCGMALTAVAPPAKPGLSLATLEREALAHNPVLKQAAASVRAAQGRTLQAGLWPNPIIGANGEHVAPVTGGGAIGGFVEQRIVTAGKLRLDRGVAREEQRDMEAAAEAQRLRVLTQLRLLFYQALGEQRLVEVRTDLARLAERAVGISQELANVGQADRPDILAAEVEAQRVDLSLVEARNALDRTLSQLAATVNSPILELSRLEGDLETIPKVDRGEAENTLAGSPELKSAQANIGRAESALRRAEVDKIPDLFLRGGLRNNREFADAGPPNPVRRVGVEGIFDVGIEIPLFNRNQGGVAAARANLDRAKLEIERTQLSLRTRLAAVYREYRDAEASVERYRTRILPKAKEAYDLYLSNFQQMAAAYPQALIAQRNFFQAQDDYVRALIHAWQSAVEVQGLLVTRQEMN